MRIVAFIFALLTLLLFFAGVLLVLFGFSWGIYLGLLALVTFVVANVLKRKLEVVDDDHGSV